MLCLQTLITMTYLVPPSNCARCDRRAVAYRLVRVHVSDSCGAQHKLRGCRGGDAITCISVHTASRSKVPQWTRHAVISPILLCVTAMVRRGMSFAIIQEETNSAKPYCCQHNTPAHMHSNETHPYYVTMRIIAEDNLCKYIRCN